MRRSNTVLALLLGLLSGLIALGATHQPRSHVGGSVASGYRPDFYFPARVAVAVDRQINVYYDQIAGGCIHGPGAPMWTASTLYGSAEDSCWRWTPTTPTQALVTFSAWDPNGEVIGRDATTVTVVSKTAGSGNVDVLFIGDSLLQQGTIVTEVSTLFGASGDGGGDITLIGTQGTAPNVHEGRSGYSWRDFATGSYSTNPFWDSANSRLDFQKYLTDQTPDLAVPEYVVVMLGVNDIQQYGSALMTEAQKATLFGYIETFLTAITGATRGFPNAQIVLVLEPYGAKAASAFGYSYGQNSTWENTIDQARYVYAARNLAAIQREIVRRYDDGAYSPNVSVCAANLWLDRRHGYAAALANASARSTEKVVRYTNYVHPNTDGYEQLADAIYSHLRYLRSIEVGGNNLLTDSENFLNTAGWTRTGNPTELSDLLAPDGETNAMQFQTDASGPNYFIATSALNGNTAVAAQNVVSFYYRWISGTLALRLSATITNGTNVYIDVAATSATPPSGLAWSFNGASLPAGYAWGTETHANGWVRLWFYFPEDLTLATPNNVGDAASMGVYIARSAATSVPLGVWGAQFEHGVTTPTTYDQKP